MNLTPIRTDQSPNRQGELAMLMCFAVRFAAFIGLIVPGAILMAMLASW